MINAKGVSMREAASVRSRVVGRLPAGSWCTVAEERVVGGTRRLHVVHPRGGCVTPRLIEGRVLLRRTEDILVPRAPTWHLHLCQQTAVANGIGNWHPAKLQI